MGQDACGGSHAGHAVGIGGQFGDRCKEFFGGHFAILHQARRARADEGFRVAQLVLVGGKREGRKNRRFTRGRQFGDRSRARPAHHQVGLRESGGHVRDERQHFALEAGFREGRAQLVASGGAGLMDDAHQQRRRTKQRPALARGLVQRARSLAAAGDQHGEALAARLGRDGKELLAHRQSGEFGTAAREVAGRLGEADERTAHIPGDTAIGEPGHGVGLHDDHRHPADQRGEHWGSGDVAAHAEDRGHAPAFQEPPGVKGADRQLHQGREPLTKTDALEAADLDQFQGEACAGHQVAFEAALGAYEEGAVSAAAEFVRYGEGRDDVAAGTAAGEEEGSGAFGGVAGGWWLVAGV